MMPLYLYLLLGSVSIPLLFSIFCIDFIKKWKQFAISTTSIAILFLIWDAFFTDLKVWGFNENYCIGLKFLAMPIEEWLFFFVIPFCSLFIHFALTKTFPKLLLNKTITRIVSTSIIIVVTVVLILNFTKYYTAINFSLLLVTLLLAMRFYFKQLQQFLITFLIILIPFFVVNGVLTGAATPEPVVWYNDAENLGIKIVTIPIEDVGYAFTMLFGNLMIFEFLNTKSK